MAAAAAISTSDERVTYGLDVVCDLESQMTTLMPKSWMEDMMFLKANNICAPTGLAPKRKTKEIQLHYGTGDSDEWRTSKSTVKESVGGLLRKLGDANFESIFTKLRSVYEDDRSKLSEIVKEVVSQVSQMVGCHSVMIRLIKTMRSHSVTLDESICPLDESYLNSVYSQWSHKCYTSGLIDRKEYENVSAKLMDIYNSGDESAKEEWAETFEYVLKDKVLDAWWKPKLQEVISDPTTPMSLCFKIEDYFDN